MSNYDAAKTLISAFAGQHNIIGVPRAFCEFMGSLEGGVFLSQLIFWSDKGKQKDGWFYKSYEEWEDEVMLSQYKVGKYSQQLQQLGVLEFKIKKANGAPTCHYRFDYQKFHNRFIKFLTMDSIKISQSITETTTVDNTETTKASAKNADASAQPHLMPEFDLSFQDTFEDNLLKRKIARHISVQRSVNARGPRKFASEQQRDLWRTSCATIKAVNNGTFEQALEMFVDKAFAKECTDRASIISYVATCAKNGGKLHSGNSRVADVDDGKWHIPGLQQ